MADRERTVDPVHDLRWVLVGLVVVVVAVLLVQAGCNTGSEHRVEDGEVRLDLSEYSITPRNLVMPAGRLIIDGRNTGRFVHSLRVVSDDDKRGNRRAKFMASNGTPLRPGDTRESFLAVCLGPGDYRIIGGQAGEEDLGMVADLHVTGPEPDCTPAPGQRREDPADAPSGGDDG
ncbi:hypothetical protein AB0L40_09975 [Patulibacter sp. NPDC049589]|uniref:hypothetical protein n=1 Tax=Patulibacter sp. NPDC049589 TaxID=3154731 RepID=UPI00341BDD37